jgi:hypothetical protein
MSPEPKLPHPINLVASYYELNCDICGHKIGYIAESTRPAVLCNLCIMKKSGLIVEILNG